MESKKIVRGNFMKWKKKTENEKGAHQETKPDSWLKTILAPLFNFLEQLFVIHRISSSR